MIDPVDNNTVAGGMIVEASVVQGADKSSGAVGTSQSTAPRQQHAGLTAWFTGLSGSGKTTIYHSVILPTQNCWHAASAQSFSMRTN